MHKLKRLFVQVLLLSACIFFGLQIYKAFTTVTFFIYGKASRFIEFGETPIMFSLFLLTYIVLFIIFFGLIIYPLFTWVDHQFKAYGGNYNLNTLKAIIRGGFK